MGGVAVCVHALHSMLAVLCQTMGSRRLCAGVEVASLRKRRAMTPEGVFVRVGCKVSVNLLNCHSQDTVCASAQVRTTPLTDLLLLHTHLYKFHTERQLPPPALPHLGLWASHPHAPTHTLPPQVCVGRATADRRPACRGHESAAVSCAHAAARQPGPPRRTGGVKCCKGIRDQSPKGMHHTTSRQDPCARN